MLAFGAKQETIEPLVLPHGMDAIEPASKHLVDVALVADIKNELVVRAC